jgi:hypothetical protein
MRYFIFLMLFVVFIAGCQKDRANWDPTPILHSVEVINTNCEPFGEVNFSMPELNINCTFAEYVGKTEDWASLKLYGERFSDSLASVNEIIVTTKGISNPCNIITLSENEIECSFWGFHASGAGAGTYYVKVKMPDSDWSNSASFEVY